MKLDGLDRIIGLVRQLEMNYSARDQLARIGYDSSQLHLHLEESNGNYAAAFYQRAHPFGLGERSDINDVAGSLTSLSLRWLGVASTRSIVVPHPAVYVSGEIYASYLIPEQPYGAIRRASKFDEDLLLSLIFGMAEAEMMTSAIWAEMDDGPQAREYSSDKPEARSWGNGRHNCCSIATCVLTTS